MMRGSSISPETGVGSNGAEDLTGVGASFGGPMSIAMTVALDAARILLAGDSSSSRAAARSSFSFASGDGGANTGDLGGGARG